MITMLTMIGYSILTYWGIASIIVAIELYNNLTIYKDEKEWVSGI